jgi:exodeoxyribonuclease VII large subunit
MATVARGYAIVQHGDGRVVRRLSDADIDDALDVRLADGRLRVRVESKS